jgi:hypothetical protein
MINTQKFEKHSRHSFKNKTAKNMLCIHIGGSTLRSTSKKSAKFCTRGNEKRGKLVG